MSIQRLFNVPLLVYKILTTTCCFKKNINHNMDLHSYKFHFSTFSKKVPKYCTWTEVFWSSPWHYDHWQGWIQGPGWAAAALVQPKYKPRPHVAIPAHRRSQQGPAQVNTVNSHHSKTPMLCFVLAGLQSAFNQSPSRLGRPAAPSILAPNHRQPAPPVDLPLASQMANQPTKPRSQACSHWSSIPIRLAQAQLQLAVCRHRGTRVTPVHRTGGASASGQKPCRN